MDSRTNLPPADPNPGEDVLNNAIEEVGAENPAPESEPQNIEGAADQALTESGEVAWKKVEDGAQQKSASGKIFEKISLQAALLLDKVKKAMRLSKPFKETPWVKKITAAFRINKPYWKTPWILGAAILLFFVIFIPLMLQAHRVNDNDLDIRAEIRPTFMETGEIFISGFRNLSVEELQEAITIAPPTDFTIRLDGREHAILELESVRDISYTFDFRMPVDDGIHSYRVVLNGQPLTVSLRAGEGANLQQLRTGSRLTLTFNEQVDIFSLEENLRIAPRTHFTLEYDRRTVTIIPMDGWSQQMNYTISIGTGYTSMNGRQFAEAQEFSFRVDPPRQPPATPARPRVDFVSNRSYILNEDRDMTLVFHGSNLRENIPVLVEIYRIPSMEKYYEQGYIYLNYDVPLSHLEIVDSNVFLVRGGENRFTLPHPGIGTYIVAANFTQPYNGNEVQERAAYLVTPYSVYMQSSVRDTLIWLNISGEGPAAGYSFYFGNSNEPAGVTAADGTLLLNLAPETSAAFRIFDPNGNFVYYDIGVSQWRYAHHQERFYSYLFTDRTLYRPDDVIHFWGFVRPFRNNVRDMPETVTVTFDSGGLDITQEIAISPNGTFYGEVELERVRSTQYNLTASLLFPVEVEDEDGTIRTVYNTHFLDSAYMSVREFTTPAFVLSSTVHEEFYGPTDDVTVTATAAFYDGTPLPNFPVELSYFGRDGWVAIGTQQTNAYGNITFSFPAWEGTGGGASPTTNRFRVRIAADGEDITHVGTYIVFPSDILVETELARQPDGRNLALTIRTFELDITTQALRDEVYQARWLSSIDNNRLLQIARGAPVDVENIEISLRWDYHDTRNIRHRYIHDPSFGYRIHFSNDYSLDYIVTFNPRVRTIEDPNTGEKLVLVNTENGEAVVTDLIYLGEGMEINFDRDVFCRARIRFTDSVGNNRTAMAFHPSPERFREDWGDATAREPVIIRGHSFEVENLTTGAIYTPRNYGVLFMDVGDTARFTLLHDSMPVPTDGTIMYSIVQDGVVSYTLVHGDSFYLTYTMAHGMSFNLVAVYFDGMGTRSVRHFEIFANTASMGLNVEVTPDRPSYRPGDSVTLSVSVTDQRGNGVAGNLCIAVVDEAIFALSEQHVDVLNGLHSNVRFLNNSVRQYFTTYRNEVEEGPFLGDGGKGGGGGLEFYDSFRSDFRDTAFFFPTTTNAQGNATITFTLPDNTTSWRITALQVGHDLSGGQSRTNIISTLPFFTRPVLTPMYIEGDDFAMLVQGHGILLSSDSEIHYTVTVTGDDFYMTQTAVGFAHQPMEFNFGKLPVGNYTVTARSQYGGFSDTVELPVNVIVSNLELVVNRPLDLSQPIDIDAMRFPVTITFYDRETLPFMRSISSLFGHHGMQTSHRLARVIAREALRYSMPGQPLPSHIANVRENVADMQNWDGGIGPRRYSDSEPLITMYSLLVAREQFNLRRMTDYFNRQLERLTDPKEIAASHLGLAVIGEMDAEAILEYFEASTRRDIRAYYIAALAVIGETELALELYERYGAPHVAARYAVRPQTLTWERDAAAAWIAASLLQHPDADALSLYSGGFRWRSRTVFERMIYVSNYDRVITPASLSYSVNGQTHNIQLGSVPGRFSMRNMSGQVHTVVLSRSALESFEILSFSEGLSATAHYIGEPDEIGIYPSDNMSIDKSIAPVDDNTYEVTLTIRLTRDAPMGWYDISDWIPSNSRLYSFDRSFTTTTRRNEQRYNFQVRQENQNLYVSFNHTTQSAQTIIFRYRVRVTYNSEAVLDRAYMIHGDTGENNNSERGMFRPRRLD